MREGSNKKKRKNSSYNTICTILGTLLVVAVVWVISLAWNTLGRKTNEVSYSAGENEIVGSVPATRKFEPGDEVVVRAAEISMSGKEFAGWKDANGVLDVASDILVNGTVFIMPETDVVLEAVWEEDSKTDEDDAASENTTSGKTDSDAEIFYINAGKDYVNVRNNHGYDSNVIAKISDTNTKIEYNGKYEAVYDEDEGKSYDWYYVEIPSKDIKGWIRSDLLSKASEKTSKTDTDNSTVADDDGEKYLKSHKYDVALMHENADSSSDVIEKIEDEETILYFNNQSKETTDSDGDKTTWYFVKNSESGNSGWVNAKRLEHAE